VKYEIDEVIEAVNHVLKQCDDTQSFMHHHATLVTLELMKSWGLELQLKIQINNTN